MAVVETGSFSAAGKRLGQSRAVIGKRIAALEKALGAQLLNRTTRQVSVTGPGAEFYQRSRNILGEFSVAEAELSHNQSEPEGVVKLNAPAALGQKHLAPLIVEFMRRYPNIVVNLTLTDRYVDVVAEGYDLVLRIGQLADSTLKARKLGNVKIILCASPGYLANAPGISEPSDLTQHRLLHYGWQGPSGTWEMTGPEGTARVDISAAFCSNNGELLTAAACAGQGIASLGSFFLADDIKAGHLVRVLPEYEASSRGLYVLWPENKLLPTRVRLMIDFLVEHFAADPQWN